MSVITRANVADYQLFTSRHFFPAHGSVNAKYILTKSTQFNQTVDTQVQPILRLTSQQGPAGASTGTENISFGNTLQLPIFIKKGVRAPASSTSRKWVDGLDFLEAIIENYCANLDTEYGKLFLAGNDQYDAVAVKRVTLSCDANSDISVDIEFSANVENVFEFIGRKSNPNQSNDFVLNLLLNNEIPELRTARPFDVQIGLQTKSRQKLFKAMTSCSIDFTFILDEVPIYGSLVPRPIFVPSNYKVSGQFSVLEVPFQASQTPGFNRYREDKGFEKYDYDLYPPNFQHYGDISLEKAVQDDDGLLRDFSIDFSNIYQNRFYLTFSGRQMNTRVTRSVTNGVLVSNVSFFDYNYKERGTY